MKKRLAAAAAEWIERHGWHHDLDPEGVGAVYTLREHPPVDPLPWVWYLQARDDVAQLALFAVLATPVPIGVRDNLAEFVLRASFGLTVGTFELDLDDGRLRFRASVGLGSASFDDGALFALLDELHHTSTAMVVGYGPALAAALAGQPARLTVAAAED